MPYVPVPKDLNTVKTKVAFNLTKRQLICFSLAAVSGGAAYFLTRTIIGTTGAVFTLIAAALPFFFFAIYEKNGQPLEKVLKHYITAKYRRPHVRPYITNNLYAAISKQIELNKEVDKIAGKEKENINTCRKALDKSAAQTNIRSRKKS